MEFFTNIKKKWLQFRVYKYTLKYQDALSKSTSYIKISEKLAGQVSYYSDSWAYKREFSSSLRKFERYTVKSEHFKNLSDIYLSKKSNLEKAISQLEKEKDILQFKKDLDF